MRVSRRTVIASGMAGAALGGAQARAQSTAEITIYDSRSPKSRAFAHLATNRIDVAAQDDLLWRDLRVALPKGRIDGLTSWSDLVIVRGLLEEQGKRIIEERKQGNLFQWAMA